MSDTKNQELPTVQAAMQHPPIYVNVNNVPASAIPQYPAVQSVPENEGMPNRHDKNKPQSNSVSTACLIFISGGMNMVWKLGLVFNSSPNFMLTKYIIMSWFIGGIIGAVIGAFACNNVSKKLLMHFSSILVTISGILQVSDPNSYDAILASRYLNGIAVGVVFPMTFVLIGEQLVKTARGMNAASIDTVCFSLGIFIHIIYSSFWPTGFVFQSLQLTGVLNILYGVIAFILASLFIIESPVLYLVHGDEQMALDSLRRLQKPCIITSEAYEKLEEHKHYVAESKERTFMENAFYGLPALLKLCFYRAFTALGFSYIANFNFSFVTIITTGFSPYLFIFYALAKWLGSFIASFTLDCRGRKLSMICGFLITTILVFVVGGICADRLNIIRFNLMEVVKYNLIFFQLFNSLSVTSSSAYLSEAFPLAVKPYYVAIVFIVEMLVHIIIIASSHTILDGIQNISTYFFTLGALSLVFFGMAIYVMPETKCCTLRECLPKFRNFNNFRN